MDEVKSTNVTGSIREKTSVAKKPVAFGRASSSHQQLEDKENMPVN